MFGQVQDRRAEKDAKYSKSPENALSRSFAG